MFGQKIKSVFAPKELIVPVAKVWKKGMWVMHKDHIAILVKLDEPATIHLVDSKTGETIQEELVSVNSLRQAHFDEIPAIRRGISRERAKELGYGT